MGFLRLLLFPLSILYNMGSRLRNHLYTIGVKPSVAFELPVIAVGNLNVGGSGKTPMIEYLIRLLSPHYKIATLSRGYGRMTRGFVLAGESGSAEALGDEPFQLVEKFGSQVYVSVGEDRVAAIPQLIQAHPDTQVVLLDDAFQHRAVRPAMSILVTSADRPFFTDWVLPAGNLRESRTGARRAQAIVVTKCDPNLSESQMERLAAGIKTYAPEVPVFFSAIRYGQPVSFGSGQDLGTDVVLISGIGNHRPFEHYARSRWRVVEHVTLPDHHRYTKDFLEGLTRDYPGKCFLTTEKDRAKLIDVRFSEHISTMPWFCLPMDMYFLKSGTDFDNLVKRYAQRG
ncbi:MAG TPA: tetraacyldisaccharide 4'-kinase [Cytophagales bacterium]|nr:tetraacyldisaccharide 4'-kinase [Cytophagales bacterium]